mgnify:CR=1 FL=1
MFERFPYTNYNELNLDWIIKKVKELDELLHSKIDELIEKELNKFFIGITYSADSETINFGVSKIESDKVTHIYHSDTHTMEV